MYIDVYRSGAVEPLEAVSDKSVKTSADVGERAFFEDYEIGEPELALSGKKTIWDKVVVCADFLALLNSASILCICLVPFDRPAGASALTKLESYSGTRIDFGRRTNSLAHLLFETPLFLKPSKCYCNCLV